MSDRLVKLSMFKLRAYHPFVWLLVKCPKCHKDTDHLFSLDLPVAYTWIGRARCTADVGDEDRPRVCNHEIKVTVTVTSGKEI